MRRRVWLIRHGSTDWTGHRWCGTTDLPLNRQGQAEADALAEALAHRVATGTEVVSSPLRRALETADRLAPAIGSAAGIDGRLREVDFGDVEGLDWTELEARDPVIAQEIVAGARVIDWPGGESGREVTARAADLWREVEDRADDLVLVAHAGILRALLDQAVGGASGPLEIRPATVIELERRDGSWAIAS
jgi:broad specificity phosphatase PhoE